MLPNVIPIRPDLLSPVHLQFHELANVLPLLEGDRFDELVESIRAIGLLDEITVFDGAILDGRNRYRACLKLGIPPRLKELELGIDPVKFVVGRNIARRDLSNSQRSYAMAQFATYKACRPSMVEITRNKVPTSQADAKTSSAYTMEEAAAAAQSNVKYIQYGKIVMNEGTADEKEAVRTGTANVKTVARRIRARGAEALPSAASASPATAGPSKSSLNGPRLKPPDGMTVSESGRNGLRLEAEGMHIDEVARQYGYGNSTYRRIRDFCLLANRDDLNEEDRRTIIAAMTEMDSERRIEKPYLQIRPIVERIWGMRGQRDHAEKKRLEAFSGAIIVMEATCQRASELEVPHLSGEAVKDIISQINRSIENLKQLRARLTRSMPS